MIQIALDSSYLISNIYSTKPSSKKHSLFASIKVLTLRCSIRSWNGEKLSFSGLSPSVVPPSSITLFNQAVDESCNELRSKEPLRFRVQKLPTCI